MMWFALALNFGVTERKDNFKKRACDVSQKQRPETIVAQL